MTRTALLIAAITAVLYLPRLGSAPIYLAPDEVFVALHAHSLATTARDYGGRFLPFYVEYSYVVYDRSGNRIVRSGWLPPIIYYSTALVLKVLPLEETSIRVPTVLVGIINVVLMYFIGRRLFKNELLAILCAGLLALTPAHFIHSRLAMDYLYPLPFVLAWLLGFLTYLEDGREKVLFGSTLALGIGLYSYIASALVMPLYFVLTLIVLWWDKDVGGGQIGPPLRQSDRPGRAYVIATAGFLVPAALYVPWLLAHPTAVADILSKYGLSESAGTTPLQSVKALLTYHGIGNQLSHVWAFLDPRFLFFDGPMELMYSTRNVGVFLLPLAGLLVFGLISLFREPAGAVTVLLIGGFLLAPLAATLVNVTDAIYRALELLPFVVLISVSGVRFLWTAPSFTPRRRLMIAAGIVMIAVASVYAAGILMRQSRLPGAAMPLALLGGIVIVLGSLADRLRVGQMIAAGLLAIVPMQFASFYADYFTDYRHRTSLIFSGNIRGAFEEVMKEADQAGAPAIYLGKVGPYGKGGLYWTFYLTKYHRHDLAVRTIDAGSFDSDRVLELPAGSLIVTNAGEGATDAAIDRLVEAGQLSRNIIREPDGTATFLVLRRTGGA